MNDKHQKTQLKDLNSTSTANSLTNRRFTHRLGAVWVGVKIGGTWTQQEKKMYMKQNASSCTESSTKSLFQNTRNRATSQ